MKNINNIDIYKMFFIVLSLIFTVQKELFNEIKSIIKNGLCSTGTELKRVNNTIYPSTWVKEPVASMFSDFNFLFCPGPDNFIEIENVFYLVLKKYWGKNRYFPLNMKFISGRKKGEGRIRR